MDITVLGAGVAASHFLPAASQKQNVYPPSFLVRWGKDSHMLFECPEGVRFRLEEAGQDYAGIHHLAVSHGHPDHYAPIHLLQATFCKGVWGGERFANPSLALYGPSTLIEQFPALWNIHLPEWGGEYYPYPKLELRAVSDGGVCAVGDARLTARPVLHGHGRCDAVAYRLETPEGVLAYSGDTGDCPGIREVARDADVFLCECSARIGDFAAKDGYGHLDPYTAGSIALEAKVRHLVLFHYNGIEPDDLLIEEVRRSGYEGMLVMAKDGQTLEY